MSLISAKEAAERWGISQRRVATLCSEGRVAGAEFVGNTWIIPADAKKPGDWRRRHSKNDGKTARPFLKWAGGKGQLLDEIRRYYPFDGRVTKYAEPFVGGGAVLFDVLEKYDLDEVYISDMNRALIDTYMVIRDDVDSLISSLGVFEREYLALDYEGRKSYYMTKRGMFNDIHAPAGSVSVMRAALMIFLNRTCWNGLYRVNRKGRFNVPMGVYKNPVICDEANLRAVSDKLRHVTVVHGDYRKAADFIDDHTFVYFDPPYRPLNSTSSFTAYDETVFDDRAQAELAVFFAAMDRRGARILLSNSDPKNVNPDDNFFDDIYSRYKISRVSASRMINSRGDGRGKITELLISNFGPTAQ